MLTSRDIVVLSIMAMLLVGYVYCATMGLSDAAHRLGELLTIIVVAAASYYLGYSKQQHNSASKNPATIQHFVPKQVSRLGYWFVGFGMALILQHIICHGIDLIPSELLLGHEWIGLYCIVAGMIMIGYAKKIGVLIAHK